MTQGDDTLFDSDDLRQNVKMFINDDSYAFRISKHDRELLNADLNTCFEKIVSPDGKAITFKKVENERPNIVDSASELYDKHSDLMKRLENE